MGIGSWFKKLMAREDAGAMRRAEERSHETAEERRASSGDFEGMQADNRAARSEHEPNIEAADRLGETDE
jgi:hypothetical protein